MKSEVVIRFAAPADAGLLAELGRETFHDAFIGHPLMPTADLNIYLNETFTVPNMARELEDTETLFLLAELAGEPAGYAKLGAGAPVPGGDAANPIKLKGLYSRQKFLGAGIGAVLMGRCLQEAADRRHDAIWLAVWEHNSRARAFYRKWRFEPRGFIDFQLGRATMRDFLMQRTI